MKFRIDMDQDVAELVRHLHPHRKRKIKQSLMSLAEDPSQGKLLQDELSGLLSYRVGSLRIIYNLDEKKKQIHVIAMGPRRSIYEELTHELLALKKKKL